MLTLAAACSQQPADPPAETAATESVDVPATPTPPPVPDEPLPLDRGVYVIAGSGCEQPANAAFRVYNGVGISGSATKDCRAEPVAVADGVHEIEESCVDTYSGERRSERQEVEPHGRVSFTLTTPFGAGTYRLCPDLDIEDYAAPG